MNRKFIFDSNYVLKSIFNEEKNIDILKDFIESILDIKVQEIQIRKDLKNKYIFKKYLGFANVIIITDINSKLNIGVQVVDGLYIQNKMFLHYAQLYSNTEKNITINILDCKYFDDIIYHKIIKVKDLSYNKEQFKGDESGEIHVLELPKFKDEEIDNKEKAWIDYLKNGKLREKINKEYEKIGKLDMCLNDYWKNETL